MHKSVAERNTSDSERWIKMPKVSDFRFPTCSGCEKLTEVVKALLTLDRQGALCSKHQEGCRASSKWETVERDPRNSYVGITYCDKHLNGREAKECHNAPQLRIIERFMDIEP